MVNDNRFNPRVHADFLASILLTEQQGIEVSIANISISGIMIDATQREFRSILGERHTNFSAHQTETREMDVKFSLPGDSGRGCGADIEVRCRAVYVRRISQDSYHIGLKFLTLDTASRSKIIRYVDTALLAKSRPQAAAQHR